MKHLIDQREPITLDEIDKAIEDGRAWMKGSVGGPTGDLMMRLLAIVESTYGLFGDSSE